MDGPRHTLENLRAGRLAGVLRLDLSEQLETFPEEIFSLAETLEVLNLSGNRLSALPGDLHRLQRLQVLFCSDNRFTEWPAAVGRCPSLTMVGFKANQIEHIPSDAWPARLRWLILTDNAIERLPDTLGQCTALQKLMLAGNRLSQLPASMAACTRLELIRLSANRFEHLPAWLPTLQKLAWLAWSGNPMTRQAEAMALGETAGPPRSGQAGRLAPACIDWSDLRVGPVLGQGASGVIHQALWQRIDGTATDVAVKLFKGALTSDGLPASEMAASVAAGMHPNLLGSLGRLCGHPQGQEGLVLPLALSDMSVLAQPPSLDSCTRDVYAEGERFTRSQVLTMAQSVACAMSHLHARGISHGDLYAHNLLGDAAGRLCLGDFGAASLDEGVSARLPDWSARIEVRAFGCLLEEWLARCDEPGVAGQRQAGICGGWQQLERLRDDCLCSLPADRPGFDDICRRLA